MLVTILDFGSNWWSRFDRDPTDRLRFTRHAAYFNSSGLRCGSKVRRYWIVPGLIRFNGALNVLAHGHTRCIGKIFECAEPTVAYGGNRLFVLRQVSTRHTPDYYLLLVCSERHGPIHFEHGWKSESTVAIAVSRHKARAEALVLMQAGGWFRTLLGSWQLCTLNKDNDVFLKLEQ
jgi:hypothetical protein